PPGVPQALVATDGTSETGISIGWSPPFGATSYSVYRNTVDDSNTSTQIASGIASTIYEDTTAAVGTMYYYWAKASNANGDSGFSNSDLGFRSVSPPSGVTATDNLGAMVTVTWNVVGSATSYRVYSGASATFTGGERLVGETAATTIDDPASNFAPNTTFYWFVRPIVNGFEGPVSAGGMGERLFRTPTNLMATTTEIGSITVDWQASADVVAGYHVFRNTVDNFETAQQLLNTASLSWTQNHTAVQPQQNYYYWVRGFSGAELGELSPSVQGFRIGGVYADFVNQHGLTGAAADLDGDPDEDEEINLKEWAFGGSDPNEDSAAPIAPIGKVRFVDGENYFTICYPRLLGGTENGANYDANGVRYQARGTAGLGTWDQTPVATTPAPGLPALPSSYEWGSFRLPNNSQTMPSGFIQIEIIALP
ncbi:MAG: fibronectin type III domain-containing protein, partial [Verrucomicrobiota bacterium]